VLRYLWLASAGYRLRPWKSPYLRWRIETYSGLPAEQISFYTFWKFVWRERRSLRRYLYWVQRHS
jgi:hypothetical protein